MTPDPKTPAQRLARVHRMLAATIERGADSTSLSLASSCASNTLRWMRGAVREWAGVELEEAERHATEACRAAGIDPESIQ